MLCCLVDLCILVCIVVLMLLIDLGCLLGAIAMFVYLVSFFVV